MISPRVPDETLAQKNISEWNAKDPKDYQVRVVHQDGDKMKRRNSSIN